MDMIERIERIRSLAEPEVSEKDEEVLLTLIEMAKRFRQWKMSTILTYELCRLATGGCKTAQMILEIIAELFIHLRESEECKGCSLLSGTESSEDEEKRNGCH